MERIPLAIVGCGGMGHRHLFALAELYNNDLSQFELVGACDPVTANAESLANRAEEFFGRRPTVVGNMEELKKLDIAAVDITTTPRYHHTLGVEALQHNWHAMIEKPVALTVRACNVIRNAAAQSNRVVSVAENYRRDPVNRLAKSLLDTGVIGDPHFMFHHSSGGGNQMMISVWRHQKDQSGVLLDVGVHFADILEYFLGEVTTVYAQMRLYEPTRYNPVALGAEPTANPSGVYGEAQKAMPAEFTATADDAVFAVINFKNGAVANYVENHAGHGKAIWDRQIHGSKGSMDMPNDRSGKSLRLTLDRTTIVEDAAVLDLAPADFTLDKATSVLFGGDRLWRYDFPFELTDRKLIAVEYADFALGILGERPVEVDLDQGARSVALSYALMESGFAGGKVLAVDDVLGEQVNAYQADIDQSLGLA
ncbi:MAG: Gfo/Idh/MocA family oxidoreductase [Litorilinea sp.]